MEYLEPILSILPSSQRQLWPKLSPIANNFVLYGGTAIALQLGHRQSIDFDFFSSEKFLPDDLLNQFSFLGAQSVLQFQPNILTLLTAEMVKISFFGGLSLGRVRAPKISLENQIRLCSLLDMLAIKLKVILQRAEAKDYLDISALLGSGLTLFEGFGAAIALYGETFPIAESLKALTFFEEGDLKDLNIDIKTQLINAAGQLKGDVKALKLDNIKLDGEFK